MTKRLLLLFFWLLALTSCPAQVIVDLQKGDLAVRPKTAQDYKLASVDRQTADTLEYAGLLREAFNALSTDSLEKARLYFEEALARNPDAPGSHVISHNIGRIELAQGHFRKAADCFTQILRSLPEAHEVRLDRAKAYLQMGHYEEAVADCDALLTATAADSLRESVLFVRAASNMERRLYPQARADLTKVLTLNPANENAALLTILALSRDGRATEAMDRLNAFVSAHPQHVEAHVLRAALLEQDGQMAAARLDYDEALRCEPESIELYVGRAALSLRMGQQAAAQRDLNTIASLGGPRLSLKDIEKK